ncbi:unnamed protein product [Echinostoma caproni]|uniref:DDE_Tnp_ISL3 domain-containing protein n=1 Tax=Echinostoma caproni TaxID=27848 RepID=A0A183A1W0_9TREM|nr:unnamed protein product [Echinostoma caproni]
MRSIDRVLEMSASGTQKEALLEWLHEKAEANLMENTKYRTGRLPSLPDLVITKHPTDVTDLKLLPPLGKKDHVRTRITFCMWHPKATTKMVRNFGAMNVDLLHSRAAQLAYDDGVTSIEGLWGVIKKSLHMLQGKFAPLKPRRQLTKPIWWRAAIDKAIKRGNRSWRLYKICGSHLGWTRYTALRNAAVGVM